MKRPTCILIWIWLRKVHWPNEWIAPLLHCKHTYTGWEKNLFQSTPHLHPNEKIYQTNAQRSVDPCSSVGGNGPRCLLGGSASWVHCDADHSGPGGLQHYVTSETSIGPWFLTLSVRIKEHLWPWLLSANTFEWVFRNFLYCWSQLCPGPVSSPHLFACPRPQVHISHLDPASLSWVGHHVGSTTGGVCLHLDSEERAPRASPVMQNRCKKNFHWSLWI